MIRIVGLVLCLPAILAILFAGLYLMALALLAVGIVNTYDYFIGDDDEKATPQKQSRSKR